MASASEFELIRPAAGSSCDPIEQQERASEKWEDAIKRIADRMGFTVNRQKDLAQNASAARVMITPGNETGR